MPAFYRVGPSLRRPGAILLGRVGRENRGVRGTADSEVPGWRRRRPAPACRGNRAREAYRLRVSTPAGGIRFRLRAGWAPHGVQSLPPGPGDGAAGAEQAPGYMVGGGSLSLPRLRSRPFPVPSVRCWKPFHPGRGRMRGWSPEGVLTPPIGLGVVVNGWAIREPGLLETRGKRCGPESLTAHAGGGMNW